MKILIKENKLTDTFNNLMSSYIGMEPIDRWYEYYDNYNWSEMNSVNFYEDPEIDWEDDYWVFQYQKNFEGDNNPNIYPRLVCDSYKFGNFKSMFGPLFEKLMKNWFEENYNLPVTSVIIR